ncbi:MAG: heme exporter protein CcmB [Deltaproteobacteria bacterium]|nr:heme exporter protein CcmB [Deltaproteobacteria bacterium]
MTGPGFLRAATLVLRKELRLERRTGDTTLTALLFGALVLVVAAFALAEVGAEPAAVGPAVFWIAVGLSANLAVVRGWARERDEDALDGLRLAPVPPAAILVGKALGLAAALFVVELVLALPTVVFFRLPVPGSVVWVVPAALLATLGIAVVGTLFGAMALGGSAAEMLIGVAVYPLLVPLFLGVVEVSRAALSGGGWSDVAGWTLLLAAFDAGVGAGALWLFGPLLEE